MHTRALSLGLVLLFGCTTPAATPPAPLPSFPDMELVRLADGVYAAHRTSPLGLAVNSNSLVVVGDSGVTVVDAQFTRAATLETIAAIRGVTRLPVRYVINTHWHDDHVAGNQVYADSFPGVQFVMHVNTREDFEKLGGPNRVGQVAAAPGILDRFQRLLDQGLGGDSTPATETERASLTSAIRIMRQYLVEAPDFRVTTAGPAVDRALSLGHGDNRVEVRWFGRGNTRGDLVAWLPARRIVATGDLLVAPVPFAFGSYPAEWRTVLDSVAALQPATILPGHGPVMHDLAYLRQVQAMLGEIVDSARVAVGRGDSTSTAIRTMTMPAWRARVTGGEKWMNVMFDSFLRRPGIAAAMAEARAAKPTE